MVEPLPKFQGWTNIGDEIVGHLAPDSELARHSAHPLCECTPTIESIDRDSHVWIHKELENVLEEDSVASEGSASPGADLSG